MSKTFTVSVCGENVEICVTCHSDWTHCACDADEDGIIRVSKSRFDICGEILKNQNKELSTIESLKDETTTETKG